MTAAPSPAMWSNCWICLGRMTFPWWDTMGEDRCGIRRDVGRSRSGQEARLSRYGACRTAARSTVDKAAGVGTTSFIVRHISQKHSRPMSRSISVGSMMNIASAPAPGGPDDLAEYVRCYSKPSAMRCGFEYYRTFEIPSAFVRARIERDGKPTLPVLSVAGGWSRPTWRNGRQHRPIGHEPQVTYHSRLRSFGSEFAQNVRNGHGINSFEPTAVLTHRSSKKGRSSSEVFAQPSTESGHMDVPR